MTPADTLLDKLSAEAPVLATGLRAVTVAYLTAKVAERGGSGKEATIVLAPSTAVASEIAANLRQLLPSQESSDPLAPQRVVHIPALDISPYAEMSNDKRELRQRMAALFRLSRARRHSSPVIVLCPRALQRRVIAPSSFSRLCTSFTSGEEIDRDELITDLNSSGYERTTIVGEPGQFAVRGGVIDVFPSVYRFPVRIELFGDEVESIRHFDTESQRTLRTLNSLAIHPVRETIATDDKVRSRILAAADTVSHPSKATRQVLENIQSGSEFVGIDNFVPAFHDGLVPLSDYLPQNATWLIHEPTVVAEQVHTELEDAERRYELQIEEHRIAFPPDAHYLTPSEFNTVFAEKPQVHTQVLHIEGETKNYAECLHWVVDDHLGLRGQLERLRKLKSGKITEPLLKAILAWRDRGLRIVIACGSETRLEQMVALLSEHRCQHTIQRDPIDFATLQIGAPVVTKLKLTSGFVIAQENLVVVTDSDIFGEKRQSSRRQTRAAKRAREALKGGVADFSQLSEEDYLVHVVHGVGQYKGLRKLDIQGIPIDFLLLEYRGGNLYLPVVRIGEVQRYVGAAGLSPRLDKLGGQSFAKTRRSVSKKVHALAEELLQLYAQRAALPGHAFAEPDAMFHDFEASFEFEETPDQQNAIDDIAKDMGEPRPMDRLICGDVGYGKTEVALRAIMRAVEGNKQVAFLAPTTVLVEQHFQSMRKRFANWPIRIARLSRFQNKKQQLETIKEIASGQIDAVVGTHRLLSKDIRFKDLGLVVVDEEQRFGVSHKERFKKMRASIEVLTLTATPIPRTLHLAMTGLRDLSIIATPPNDRRAIRTFVARSEDGLMREAINKELDREGQIFFVSPRIDSPVGVGDRSLDEWAAHLGRLVPRAKIAVAHGQLPADTLENIMVAFVEGKYDILVSTTIVEAGLDIPRANTMFIDRADRFGLSQLYQLRGRIGRSKERGYCYLLVPAPEKLQDDARKRLETLQRYTELGAGFAIASQDLEIRGAGELLGAKQSGSIAAIGFDAYTQMLEEAVAELQGAPVHSERDPELNVDLPGYIPDDYILETGQRLTMYKRLASASDAEEVREILEELNDCFGPIPGEVGVLGELMVIKGQARRLHATSLELGPGRIALAFADSTPLHPNTILELIKQPKSPYRLTPDMRLVRNFSQAEQERPTDSAQAVLIELLATVGT